MTIPMMLGLMLLLTVTAFAAVMWFIVRQTRIDSSPEQLERDAKEQR